MDSYSASTVSPVEVRTNGGGIPSGPITASTRKRRVRARKACEPCRDRKRKCDGNYPCSNCVRYEYDCHFVSVRRRADGKDDLRRIRAEPPDNHPARPATLEHNNGTDKTSDNQLTSLEANSAAAFVRKLALALDPASAPRLHLFAWNLFIGGRISTRPPCVRSVVDIVSRANMESLASIFLAKVDPCYGFVDHTQLHQAIASRWLVNSTGDQYDAVLCGVAALGFLFSRIQVEPAEVDLMETAKHILEQANDARPSIDIVTGWVLRVAYLRMTASPHVAWMASCTMMHAVEASGVHLTQASQASPLLPEQIAAPELCARVFGIARHLNIWISFDLGRSRVVLPQTHTTMPSTRPGDYTTEILSLLPVSELLTPGNDPSIADLKAALRKVLAQEHSEPPSVLAQTNLTLILIRRLRALDSFLSGDTLEEVLKQMSRGIRAAEINLNTGNPWHHVANVPFQIVCILLAIDTPSTHALLGDAIRALNSVAQIYRTDATTEALNTAYLLIHLHQKRKSTDAASLAGVLQTYSSFPASGIQNGDGAYANWNEFDGLNNGTWLDDLMTDLPNLQDFDVNQFVGNSTHFSIPTQWPTG